MLHLPAYENLVVVGSSFANTIAEQLLHTYGLAEEFGFDFAFSTGGGIPEKCLMFKEAPYRSPYGEQVAKSRLDPTEYHGGFTDYGVISGIPNPWNPQARILVLAGIRALGTWGAAWHLNRHTAELSSVLCKERFAVLVKAHSESNRKTWLETEVVGVL